MKGIEFTKSEIKKYIKNINKLTLSGHKPERFKQVIFIKKGEDINDGIFLPYLVSSYGRIFSVNYHMQKGIVHEMSSKINSHGYLHLILYNNGKKYNCRVNRLVGIAFKKNDDYYTKNEVNHKNSIRTDNHAWNLYWCTSKENVDYSFKKGNRKIEYGENSNRSNYKNKDIEKVCKLLVKGFTYKEISKKTGVSYDTIVNILYKRQWTIISDKYDFSNTKYWKKRNNL